MATGYEERFETQVYQSLHCIICTEVLKDPVQCRKNEHHFCRNCITEHLRHSRTCPTCNDPLTVETLGRPQRFLANTLSSLKISCENFERGCRKVVELGSLDAHVATCGFSPVPCSNDECEEIISRRDKEIHEKKVCDFRHVKCDYCAQMVLYKNFMQHTCPARQEIREMKAELRQVRSTQDEMIEIMQNVRSTQDQMVKMMRNMISSIAKLERNPPQRSEGSHANSGQELQAKIVVAGGSGKSVEVFNMTTKTWRTISEMNECRYGARSVLYQSHMIVTGGYHCPQYLDSVEELNLDEQVRHWIESQFKLPAPSCGHACVVYQNRVFLIGGYTDWRIYDTIHEISLTPPYTSGLLIKMPRPISYHSAEIVNGKIYIIGGSTTVRYEDAINTVLMFDPATNTCTELKPLPYPVSRMATVTWKDNVVVLGGLDNQGKELNTVILYNVTTGSHRMLPEMTEKRSDYTAVIIGDNIIVIGGSGEYVSFNSVECYNFQTNTWTEFPAMAKARIGPTAVVKYY